MTLAERRKARADILADEAVRGREHQPAKAGAGAGCRSELVTPFTASAASSAASASSFSRSRRHLGRRTGRDRGSIFGQQRRIGEALIGIFRRHLRHGHGALGQLARIGARRSPKRWRRACRRRRAAQCRRSPTIPSPRPCRAAPRRCSNGPRTATASAASAPAFLAASTKSRDAVDEFGGIDAVCSCDSS